MLTTYKHRGEALDFINSGDEVIKAGEVRVIGSRIGVIGDDIAPGAVGGTASPGFFGFKTKIFYTCPSSFLGRRTFDCVQKATN